MAKSSASKPSRRPVLGDDVLQMIANRFKVLSEPTRLKLLMALEEGERTVSELTESSGATQTNVSRQLAILARAGMLDRRREGANVYYRIVDPAIFRLCDHVCGSLQRDLERTAVVVRSLEPAKR